HMPRWLTTPGMGEAKIAAFYDDPVKQACDALSVSKAYRLRSASIDPAMPWAVLRWVKFAAHWGRSILRRLTPTAANSTYAAEDEAQDQTPTWASRTPAHK